MLRAMIRRYPLALALALLTAGCADEPEKTAEKPAGQVVDPAAPVDRAPPAKRAPAPVAEAVATPAPVPRPAPMAVTAPVQTPAAIAPRATAPKPAPTGDARPTLALIHSCNLQGEVEPCG